MRQPLTKKTTLNGAREGLSSSMRDFVAIRQEQIKVLDSQIGRRTEALQSVTTIQEKRSSLEKKIADIQEEATGRSVRSLKSEVEELDLDIQRK